MSRQKNSIWINEHELNHEPVPFTLLAESLRSFLDIEGDSVRRVVPLSSHSLLSPTPYT